MRRILLMLGLIAVPLVNAEAWIGPIEGNDTGGIIAWSPANQRAARTIAVEHCARYGKLAHITSVWPRYGQYIGFACQLPESYSGTRHHHRRRAHAVLRVRD
jgi:hypothetical protein